MLVTACCSLTETTFLGSGSYTLEVPRLMVLEQVVSVPALVDLIAPLTVVARTYC